MTGIEHGAEALFQVLSRILLDPRVAGLCLGGLCLSESGRLVGVHLEEEIVKAPSPQQHHKAKTALLLQRLPSPPGTSTPASRGLAA